MMDKNVKRRGSWQTVIVFLAVGVSLGACRCAISLEASRAEPRDWRQDFDQG